MRGYRDFIVKADYEFAKTFKTEGGLELEGDSRYSYNRLANNIVTVMSAPYILEDCVIKPGYQVMIDTSIYFRQDYNTIGTQENPFMIDRAKGIYKIEPGMIILYRETPESEWTAYEDNALAEPIKEVQPARMAGTLLLEEEKTVVTRGWALVVHPNEAMKEEGLAVGDRIAIRDEYAVPVYIEGKEYLWINTSHVLAKAG